MDVLLRELITHCGKRANEWRLCSLGAESGLNIKYFIGFVQSHIYFVSQLFPVYVFLCAITLLV